MRLFFALDPARDLMPGYGFKYTYIYPLAAVVVAAAHNGRPVRASIALARVKRNISNGISNTFYDGKIHKLDYVESILSRSARKKTFMHSSNATTVKFTVNYK